MQESALLSAFVPIIVVACVILAGAIYYYSKERKEAGKPINIKKVLIVVGACAVVIIILVVIILLCTGKLSSYEYRPYDNGGIIITKYTGNRSTVKVPEKIGGKTVVAIAEHAFENPKIKEIQLPSTIASIHSYAFAKTSITTITLPESLEHIKCNAFSECENLKEIIFQDPNNWGFPYYYGDDRAVNVTDKEDNVVILETFGDRILYKNP